MALEIERKFLVISDNWQRLGTPEVVRQGYLSRDIERTVRVRIKGDKAFLTIKGRNEGAVLLDTLALKPLIEKTRTKVAYAGKIWEIDRFFGENEGLVLAEVELASENETVQLPPWIGQEVTHLTRYYNSALSERPYCEWTEEEKAGL